jgi:hypothetical protein
LLSDTLCYSYPSVNPITSLVWYIIRKVESAVIPQKRLAMPSIHALINNHNDYNHTASLCPQLSKHIPQPHFYPRSTLASTSPSYRVPRWQNCSSRLSRVGPRKYVAIMSPGIVAAVSVAVISVPRRVSRVRCRIARDERFRMRYS